MKLVIYRNKKTNEITMCHGVTRACTQDNFESYNSNEKNNNRVEIVELEEDSLAYDFYKMKTKQIQEEADDLRNLMDDLQNIVDRIDSRLYDFDRWFESERGGTRDETSN